MHKTEGKAYILSNDSALETILTPFLETQNCVVDKIESNAETALFDLLESPRDLVYLDYEIDVRHPFNFAKLMRKHCPSTQIIALSTEGKHAIDAIKHEAVSFLLKPISDEALRESFNTYLKKVEMNTPCSEKEEPKNEPVRLKIALKNETAFVNLSHIVYCEADGAYCKIHLRSGEVGLISSNLKKVEQTLSSSSFVRANRSNLINLTYLTEVNRQDLYCKLSVGDQTIQLKVSIPNLKYLLRYKTYI